MRRLLSIAVALALLVAPTPARSAQAAEGFARGVDAYRRGAYAEAEALWRACLEHPLPAAERARVAYNLGNAAWRRDRPLEAIGWYTVALRHAPRHRDAWHNLELVRASAGLDPADRGDLRSTVNRLLTALRPDERRTLVLAALVPLALLLVLEALLGGRLWRRLGLAAALLVLLAAAPWIHGQLTPEGDPLLVVRTPAAPLRTEPRHALAPIGELLPGDEVQRVDELPGWTRVQTREGTRGWVQDDAVFSLRP